MPFSPGEYQWCINRFCTPRRVFVSRLRIKSSGGEPTGKVQSRESRVLRLGFEDRRREFQAYSFDPIALFFGTHLELCVVESS
jgi:hypothetical protein